MKKLLLPLSLAAATGSLMADVSVFVQIADTISDQLESMRQKWEEDVTIMSDANNKLESLVALLDEVEMGKQEALQAVKCEYDLNERIIALLTTRLNDINNQIEQLKNELSHYITMRNGVQQQINDIQAQIDEVAAQIQDLVGQDTELFRQFMDLLEDMQVRYIALRNTRTQFDSLVIALRDKANQLALKTQNDMNELKLILRKNYPSC